MKSYAKESVSQIKTAVKDKKLILGLSGGVDSSVTALLIHKAIGNLEIDKHTRHVIVDEATMANTELIYSLLTFPLTMLNNQGL